MSNSNMPKKALILYCPFQPNQPIPNVDIVTLKGCSGQMALEEAEEAEQVLQLLGLYDNNKNHQIKTKFEQRFNDMSLAIISNQKSSKDIAQQLECLCSDIESIDQIKQLLSTTQDVIFIDFTNYNTPQNTWNFINELLAVVADNKDIIQCAVSSFTITNKEKESTPLKSIIPPQSHVMKNGSQVDTINHHTALMYSYLHSGSGRIDNTTKYTIQDIQEHGGNNKILAWHFLAEIGHKLGFVPKYGA